MKLRPFAVPALAVTLLLSAALPAQEAGYWRATSSNAHAITGDVSISDSRLVINFLPFPIAQIRDLKTDEMLALFNPDNPAAAVGHLYKLDIASDRRFLHKNTLCGSDSTQWMATAILGRELRIAFFSSREAPVFTIDTLNNSSDVCGTFTYTR